MVLYHIWIQGQLALSKCGYLYLEDAFFFVTIFSNSLLSLGFSILQQDIVAVIVHFRETKTFFDPYR